jgi:hypothetical protein
VQKLIALLLCPAWVSGGLAWSFRTRIASIRQPKNYFPFFFIPQGFQASWLGVLGLNSEVFAQYKKGLY